MFAVPNCDLGMPIPYSALPFSARTHCDPFRILLFFQSFPECRHSIGRFDAIHCLSGRHMIDFMQHAVSSEFEQRTAWPNRSYCRK